MKISVSLPEEDVTFLDSYTASSRSAAIHEAINLLRQEGLKKEYEAAFEEWDGTEDARLWDNTVADGIGL
jgi:Arc/MetJ-type ribon-helix-helix transcriptional regulator